MIKHSVKGNILNISIKGVDFSYRIPLNKLGNTSDWRIGKKEVESIVMKSVSTWALQLFTKKVTEIKYITQFQSIVQEHCPDNTINWEDTLLAVNIQNKYNWLITSNATAKKKIVENELISTLKKKYKL